MYSTHKTKSPPLVSSLSCISARESRLARQNSHLERRETRSLALLYNARAKEGVVLDFIGSQGWKSNRKIKKVLHAVKS